MCWLENNTPRRPPGCWATKDRARAVLCTSPHNKGTREIERIKRSSNSNAKGEQNNLPGVTFLLQCVVCCFCFLSVGPDFNLRSLTRKKLFTPQHTAVHRYATLLLQRLLSCRRPFLVDSVVILPCFRIIDNGGMLSGFVQVRFLGLLLEPPLKKTATPTQPKQSDRLSS